MPVGRLDGKGSLMPRFNCRNASNPRRPSRDRAVAFAHCRLLALHLFGSTVGRRSNRLKQAGIDSKDIDAVVMTHALVGHLCGNNARDGTSDFPNVRLYIT